MLGKLNLLSHSDIQEIYLLGKAVLLVVGKPRSMSLSACLQGESFLSRLPEAGEKGLPLRLAGVSSSDLVALEKNPGIFPSASLDLSLLLLSVRFSLLVMEACDAEPCL
jgi:hypothetical protein